MAGDKEQQQTGKLYSEREASHGTYMRIAVAALTVVLVHPSRSAAVGRTLDQQHAIAALKKVGGHFARDDSRSGKPVVDMSLEHAPGVGRTPRPEASGSRAQASHSPEHASNAGTSDS